MWNLKKVKFIETVSRIVVARGGGNRERLVKRYKFPVTRWIGSEYLMYNMVNIVGNTVLCK